MDRIAITNDTAEMVRIAKGIVEEKKKKYDAGLMDMIKADVRKRCPDLSEADAQELVYVTIYNYWVYGVSFDEYFYYDFAHKTHEEKLEYMTYRVRLIYGDKINKIEMKHLLMNKFETYEYFKEFFKRDVTICRSDEDYPAFLDFIEKHPEFVVKPIDMGGGRGVHKEKAIGLDEKGKHELFDALVRESDANKKKYLRGNESAVILEELIDQDDDIAVFNRESVNGVRVNTLLKDGEVIIYEPWLKIGRGGNFLTSAVFGTMDAGIDPKTGVVDTHGYTETGEIWEKHPDNGIVIKGFAVPKWDELVEMAKECALKVPFFTYVAWDFALSKKGWCIMEGNYCGDFMWQLYRNRGTKKEFEELIGWKLDKEFWWQAL